MRHFALLVTLLIAIPFGGCCCEHKGYLTTAAQDLDRHFIDDFNRGDVPHIMTHYWNSPETVMISPDGHITQGYAQIQDTFTKLLADMNGAKLEILDARYREEGDLVYAWGTWRITYPMANPPRPEATGVFSQVAARRNGTLVYLLDHPALTLPPEPKPAK